MNRHVLNNHLTEAKQRKQSRDQESNVNIRVVDFSAFWISGVARIGAGRAALFFQAKKLQGPSSTVHCCHCKQASQRKQITFQGSPRELPTQTIHWTDRDGYLYRKRSSEAARSLSDRWCCHRQQEHEPPSNRYALRCSSRSSGSSCSSPGPRTSLGFAPLTISGKPERKHKTEDSQTPKSRPSSPFASCLLHFIVKKKKHRH